MEITIEVYKALEGLYVNQIVSNKYELEAHERKNVREKNAQSAERLDELKVSWTIQNQVAYAGTKSENWERYNRDVINEVIEKYNN